MSRILVVDDALPARESLAKLLTSAGHSTATAANGRDAWLTLYEGLPDLILLDLMMPQMDGITFLRLLRHSDHWAHVPVVVVTGFCDDEDLVGEARTLGVTTVVPKQGCGIEQLLALVEQALVRQSEPLRGQPAPSRSRRSMAGAAA
jgi:CheY-like chemotaxis protein